MPFARAAAAFLRAAQFVTSSRYTKTLATKQTYLLLKIIARKARENKKKSQQSSVTRECGTAGSTDERKQKESLSRREIFLRLRVN